MGDLRGSLRAVALLGVVAGAVAFAPDAGATTFCVSDPGCVSAGGTSEPDLPSAFTAASNDAAPPSTVKVGPGTYGIGSLVFNKPSQLTVIGAGRGQTILTTSGGGLAVSGNSNDLITSLSLRGTGFGASQLLSLGGGTADGVDVNLDAPGTAGVALFGSGTVKHSSVTVTGDADATALGFETGPSIVQDTTLTGPEGLVSGGVTIMQRVRCEREQPRGQVPVDVRVRGLADLDELGLERGVADRLSGRHCRLTGANLTIVGPTSASVAARCAGAGTAHAAIDSSILRGAVLHTLQASTTGATSHAEIDPTYDEYDPSTSSVSGPGATITGPGADSINADPLFIDAAAGDYRIPFNSPAVNAGNPAVLGLLDSTTDLAGQPRVVGGRRDIGALEYQHQPPIASIAQDLTSAITGQPVTFTGGGSSDPDPGDTLSYSWSFDDGTNASTSTVHHAFANAGTHVVHLTVIDPTGLSASASASVHVTPLTLSGLTQSARVMDARQTSSDHRPKFQAQEVPVGTTFTSRAECRSDRPARVHAHLLRRAHTREVPAVRPPYAGQPEQAALHAKADRRGAHARGSGWHRQGPLRRTVGLQARSQARPLHGDRHRVRRDPPPHSAAQAHLYDRQETTGAEIDRPAPPHATAYAQTQRCGSAERASCATIAPGWPSGKGAVRAAEFNSGMPQNFIACDREQEMLLPPSLLDWVPPDHLVWTVLASVEEMDLSAFYGVYRPDGHGRPAYDPRVIVALLFYACAQGVRSSRGIERKCREDVAFMVITAMRVPDHSTIADFRKRHETALAGLFTDVLGLCAKAGLVTVGLIAIDGTKISANASMDANRSYERIARELLDEVDETDRREDEVHGDARGDELPEQLCTPEGRRAALREAKRKLDAERETGGDGDEGVERSGSDRRVRS